MAIAKLKPDAEIKPVLELPQVQKETYQGIVADNNNVPHAALVAYIDGMPWTVDYYGQLLGKHNDLREIDPGQNAAFQQYQKTKALELRVASPLQTSYDSENAITTVSGSAHIVHIVPNVNDYFIANAGSREAGLFRVKSVERKVFNRDSVYLIDYDLVTYANDESELCQDLEAKVVRVYRFSKERLTEGLSPVLREEIFALSTDIAKSYQDTIQHYFRKFFNRTQMTLVVPGQSKSIYDTWLVLFIIAIIDSRIAPELRDMKVISTDHERYLDQGSLWQVLLDRQYDNLEFVHQKTQLAPRTHFNRSSWLKGTAYWNMDYYVYPIIEDHDVHVKNDPRPQEYAFASLEGQPIMETLKWKERNTYTDGVITLPLIKSVLVDNYYVLSKAFYEGDTDLSVLEVLVKDYLKYQTIDLVLLAALVKEYKNWPVLEQFYYGPLLILLMKDAVKGFYQ